MSDTFNDYSPMPFGKFKGQKLANVPASYLIWLGKELTTKKLQGPAYRDHVRLLSYIDENMDALKLETKAQQT